MNQIEDRKRAMETSLKERQINYKEDLKNLLLLSERICSSHNGKVVDDDGRVFTRKDLRKFQTSLLKEFDSVCQALSKINSRGKNGKSRRKRNQSDSSEETEETNDSEETSLSKKKAPIHKAKYMNDNFVEYFKTINLGDAYEKIKNDDGTKEYKKIGKLNDLLPLFFKSKITSCASLTPLFVIVMYIRNLQFEKNKQYIIPDDKFKKYFGDIFIKLRQEQEEEIKTIQQSIDETENEEELNDLGKTLKKKEKAKVDPEMFRFVRFQTIVSKSTVKDIDEKEKEILKSDSTVESVIKEHKIISDTLSYYRKQKKLNKK
jgi:hypothetical protein